MVPDKPDPPSSAFGVKGSWWRVAGSPPDNSPGDHQSSISMTSFIAWLGVDSRGPTSMYFASDSRISWDKVPGVWDCGQKVFAANAGAEIAIITAPANSNFFINQSYISVVLKVAILKVEWF